MVLCAFKCTTTCNFNISQTLSYLTILVLQSWRNARSKFWRLCRVFGTTGRHLKFMLFSILICVISWNSLENNIINDFGRKLLAVFDFSTHYMPHSFIIAQFTHLVVLQKCAVSACIDWRICCNRPYKSTGDYAVRGYIYLSWYGVAM